MTAIDADNKYVNKVTGSQRVCLNCFIHSFPFDDSQVHFHDYFICKAKYWTLLIYLISCELNLCVTKKVW